MKFSALALLLASSASAFVVVPSRPAFATALNAAAAKSKEEDLELTREVIAKFQGMDTPSAAAEEEPAAEEPQKKKKKGKKSD